MNVPTLRLVSHHLCPYVQRAVIVLTEKAMPFERVYVDLAHPPQWFAKISPLGKVPLLQVGDDILFESAIICEYLDETVGERIHPADPLQRAKHRAWMEFGSTILDSIWAFYTAPDMQTLEIKAADLRDKFARLEMEIMNGPYFSGNRFSMVDAVFGPIFRYFDVFDEIADFRFFDDTPKVRAWREVLAARPSVITAVSPEYPGQLRAFLKAKSSELSRFMAP
ncbi:MAG: glutathione S-transferase family protein [Gammaproteobacteria bacterium]|nr:glutathione S-transferase family protein [Gammaproteobacteria bacterium]